MRRPGLFPQLILFLMAAPWGISSVNAHPTFFPLPQSARNRTPSPISKSVVSGFVEDQTGSVIEGATVTVIDLANDSQQTISTDTGGSFHFEGVPSGKYRLEVQKESFAVWRSSLQVGPGTPALLKITLALGEMRDEITVSSSALISPDASDNLNTLTLDSQEISALPVLGDDVVSAVAQMVGASSGSEDVTVIVDGVPTSATQIPAAMIQQITINNNPYSAEFGAPGKARIEIITKSGSASYHGSLRTMFRDSTLDAKNAFATEKPPERRRYFEATLSGPLGRDGKTVFITDLTRKDDNLQSIVNALTLAGADRQDSPNPQASTLFTAGLTRKISAGHTFSARYSFFDWSDRGAGVGGLTLPGAAYNNSSRMHYVNFSDSASITARLVNQFGARLVTSEGSTRSTGPPQPEIVVLGAFIGGNSQIDQYETDNHLELSDMLLWSKGNHLIKAGLNMPTMGRRGLNDRSNVDGTFQFSSLADYAQGAPFSFVQQQGNGHLAYWQEELGAFAQDDIRIRPNFSLAIGLRYDWQNHVSKPLNFAPRASFAYSPRKLQSIVLRGGAGVFYQTTGPQAIADMLRFNGSGLRQFIALNPSYPEPSVNAIAGQILPTNIVRFASDLRMPYTLQYSIGLEWRLKHSTALTATYKGARGFDLFLSRDLNAPVAPPYTQRPDPNIGRLREIESAGRLISDALEVSVSTKLSRLFTGGVQYTFGKSEDNTGGINWFPANQYDLTGEWSRSNSDSRHFVYVYGSSSAAKYFQIGLMFWAYSGRPYTMTTGTDVFGTGLANARPGGVARNSLSGSGANTFDIRLSRAFSMYSRNRKEGPSLNLAIDAFNVLNHTNFSQYIGNVNSPLFGQSISAGPARQLQISLGFDF